MKITSLLCIAIAALATQQPALPQVPGNLNDEQWAETLQKASSVAMLSIQSDPEKYNGKVVIVFGRIGGVQLGDPKHFVVQQLYQPKSPDFVKGKNFSWEDWWGMTQADDQPAMRVYFGVWHTNCASTQEGRDRIRSLSTKGGPHLLGPFNQDKFAVIGVVRLFSDSFQPYLSLVDFRPMRPGATTTPSGSDSRPPAQPALEQTQYQKAVSIENARVRQLPPYTQERIGTFLKQGYGDYNATRWAEAAAAFEKVLAIDSQNFSAHWHAGEAYERLSQLESAEKHLQAAIQLIPSSMKPHVVMCCVLAKRNDTTNALASLERAVKNGYSTAFELRTNEAISKELRESAKFIELTAVSIDILCRYRKDASLFESRTEVIPMSYDATWTAVQRVLKEQKEKIRVTDKESGVVITENTEHGLLGSTFDQYFIVFERVSEEITRLNFKLFTYYDKTEKDGRVLRLPERPGFIDARAKKFIQNVSKPMAKK
jgi:tetratricopeptide (TPR) repeat protein